MPGKPGMTGEHLGGRREGAGRPPSKITLQAGDQFAVSTEAPGASMAVALWTVESVSRTAIVIKSSAGETYRLVR